ncbi:hypothetical protein GCM10023149_38620 [Mucilaginibacter gynuensis]|uniref:Uncharacterized protein n=1 Tax=Mucilaginibacter gynuensis TaxID=1302236 RepID=A0ABP8H011_9SPHI
MGKKIALNVLYNVGIVIAIIIGYWGVEHGRYEFLLGAIFIGGVFIALKIRLRKEVKELIDQHRNNSKN